MKRQITITALAGALVAGGLLPAFAAGGFHVPGTGAPVAAKVEARPAASVSARPDDASPTRTDAKPVRARRVPAKDPTVRFEQLKMGCRGFVDGEKAGIGCRWTQSQHPRFNAYRLWRSDGEHRAIVFRTEDRTNTHFFDTEVRPGHEYIYKVEVLNADGDVIGAGGPVHAKAPAHRLEQLRMACRGFVDGDKAMIGCKWSPSQHPRFNAYRLWKSDGEHRSIVFRTEDRELTHFRDTEVRKGHTYIYKVEVLNADGVVIGEGGPVKVSANGDPQPAPADPKPTRDGDRKDPAALDPKR